LVDDGTVDGGTSDRTLINGGIDDVLIGVTVEV
jgi:hypothetical protein